MGTKNIEAIYPLSPTQQGMIFHSLSAPESGVYVEHLVLTLRGDLSTAAFEQAWQQVVDRHAVLRTLFVWERSDQPLQVVRQKVQLPFEQHDWRGLSPHEQDERLDSLLTADRRRGFNLSEAPLMRLALVRMGEDSYRFFWSHHHAILDGWSVPLVLKEVFAFYEAFRQGRDLRLERSRPFQDYIAWLKRQDLSQAEMFWREMLNGFEAPTPLVVDRSINNLREDEETYGEQEARLSPQATARLQALARQYQLTLNTLVQGAWAMLLSRYAGEETVVFGATVAGRPASLNGVESMVGLFINTLPVRVRVPPRSSLISWLKDLQRQQVELRQYEYSPLGQIQGWIAPQSGTPLFESILVFENYPLDASLLEANNGLKIVDVRSEERTNYPLTVAAVPNPSLLLQIAYDRRRFADASITRMLGHLQILLLGIAENPERCLADLPLLTEAERHQLLVEWNDTQADYPQSLCLHELFEEQVRRHPEAIAVVFEDQRLTYDELNRRANQLAHHLCRLGVGPEVRVGLCAGRSLALVVGVLGVLKAGGVYVPLEAEYPVTRLAFMLEDAQAQLLLTEERLVADLPRAGRRILRLDKDWEEIARESDTNPSSAVAPDNLAYVIYTSGTTGRPKGVMVSHRAVCNHLHWMQTAFPLTESDRVPLKYSLCFDVSILELFYPLLAGARLIVVRPGGHLDSAYLSGLIAKQKITAIDLVPSMLKILLEDEKFRTCHWLRRVTCGGEILSVELHERFFDCLDAELHNLYGPTEATIGATFWTCQRGHQQLSVPIGRPINNTEVYLLDAHLQPVPIGVPGHIYLGGIALARGYLGQPALTAAQFVPHPFSQEGGARLYRTGDVGRYLADGSVEFVGRSDGQVKVRGYRVEVGEIEEALAGHAGVRAAAVVGVEGEVGESRLVAYVVSDKEHELTTNELRSSLKKKLPEHMIPSAFVMLSALPLMPSGKVDRRALPAPNNLRPRMETAYVAPRSHIEEALAEIWASVLGVAQVGMDDNFFELGGDSILSLQINARANKAGLHLTPQTLFERQTIRELAEAAGGVTAVRLHQQGTVAGEVALTPVQHWFFELNLAEAQHYNQAIMLEAKQALDPTLLQRAVNNLLEHHDALRLRFTRERDEWRQFNAAQETKTVFATIDLSKLSESDPCAAIAETAAELQASFNLTEGPLVRMALLNLGGDRPQRLLIVIHHLAVDGVSWRILLDDLQAIYQQLSHAQAIQLPPKTTSFKEWARQLQERAQSAELKQELNYWLTRPLTHVAPLPVDHLDGNNTEASARSVMVSLTAEETRSLLQDVPTAYHTQINEVLLTALAQAFAEWTGQRSFLLDLEGHGREQIGEGVDVSRTVGWFTTIFPVLLELSTTADSGAALKSIKEGLRQVPQKGIGYGMLRYLSTDQEIREQIAALPQAEVSFNYLGQLDQTFASDLFSLAEEGSGPARSPRNQRGYLLEIEAQIISGRLRVEWSYSEGVHKRETMERVASDYIAALRRSIAHCLLPEAGGYTPSDFPLANLEQQALDKVIRADRQVEDIYPLSPTQQGLLFHSLYEPQSGIYVAQLSCTLHGPVNITAFERAWQQVLDRHAVLRTSFVWEGLAEPVQVVWSSLRLSLEQHDWSELSWSEQQGRLESFLEADRDRGFELSTTPLLRLTQIRVDAEVYELVWSSHHLLLDGWSMSVLLKEVFELYEAFCRGEQLHLELSRPYRDYIAWLKQQDLAKAEKFWRETFKGFNAPTPLTVGRNDNSLTDQDARYREQEIRLSPRLTTDVHAFAREHQLTLSTLIQGAWAMLLSRYSGEIDIVFGLTVSGRPAALAGVETMVGLFINTLPMRVQIPTDASSLSWLKELQRRQVEMQQYEYSPLVRVQEWSEVARGVSLFESILVVENYPIDASLREQKGGLRVSNVRSEERTNYPLTLMAQPDQELLLKIAYDRRRFADASIMHMLGHLQTLLQGLTAWPQRLVGDLPLLTEVEHEQLLFEWNKTRTDYPSNRCIHQLFEEQVERTPDSVAVVSAGEQLTYAELNRRANQLAHHLREAGVEPEVCVGLCMERSVEMIVGLLGVLKAGGAYVPLDPSSPLERLAFMLADTQASVVLTQERLLRTLPEEHRAQAICLDTNWESIARQNERNPDTALSTDNLAYIIYTSGSTGAPKGVGVIHRGVVRLVKETNYARLGPTEVFLQLAPLAFDASTFEIWSSLLNGARLVLLPSHQPSLEELGQALRRYRVTTLWLTAGLFHQMVDHQLEDLKQVRQLLAGGDVLSGTHVERFLAAADGSTLINGYGPTENTTFTCCHSMWKPDRAAASVPIGRPVANTEVYILDRNLRPVAQACVGELYIGGCGLARGYFNRPGLTAEKFIPHPFGTEAGARLYRSGDLARYSFDGNIEFLGRIDRQAKVRGFRVEPGEIEAVLGQHPTLLENVVVAREDAPGEKRLIAYLVARDDQPLEMSELRSFLKGKLPEHMIPTSFVLLDELPLTPSGKVDRRALPAPDQARLETEEMFIAPRTPIEEALAAIWAEVLGVKHVSIRDNFFALGGHSLLATQVISHVRKVLQVELPLSSIFEEPTVGGLAKKIEAKIKAGQSSPSEPIRRIPRDGHAPLSFAQQRLWFLNQLEPNSDFYNVPAAVHITGRMNVSVLVDGCNEILRRHESLRTTFITSEGEPRQVIAPAQTLNLPIVDLSALPAAEREAQARRSASEEAQRPFDLRRGPLLRAGLVRLGEEEHLLLLTMHHIISDGWSMNILLQELTALYEAFSSGRPSPLSELPIQYADFALWQREWLSGEVLKTQLAYWKEQLRGAPTALELPTDRVRPKVQTHYGAEAARHFSRELSDELKSLSRREDVTLFMTLLAAFQLLLSRYSGQEEIVVGSPIANRTRTEIEGLVGFFVNTLALRTDLSGNPSFRQVLARVRKTALEAYAHQDIPFEKLVEELQPPREMSRHPLFQVMFVLQNTSQPTLAFSGLTLRPLEMASHTSKFDLMLTMEETGQGLKASLEYNTDLFDATTITRMLGHLETLLEGIVADPVRRVADLTLLTETERHQLLVEWNATKCEFGESICLHELFERQVERTPDRVALISEDQRLTYSELNRRANKLAHYLRSLGVRPETLVALCAERSVEMIVGLLGVLKAGGAYVPLDPSYPPERLAFMLEDAQVPVVLTQKKLVAALPMRGAQPVVCLDADWDVIAEESEERLATEATAENLAYVIYTSGSTGKPKGVMISHKAISNHMLWMQQTFPLEATDRVLQKTTFSFDASVWEFYAPLLVGAQLVMARAGGHQDPSYLIELINEQRVTILQLVPSLLRMLVEQQEPGLESCQTLRRVFCGGEALTMELSEKFSERPTAELINLYGPTEAAIDVTSRRCERRRGGQIVPLGRPIANTQIYILDKHLHPVPVGVIGELYIGGEGLGRGYRNRPELTAEKFIPHPFGTEAGARLYTSGDLARYLPSADIEFVGRTDEQVKVRGYRIELGEVEAALSGHPHVREAVVLARDTAAGEKQLAAYLTTRGERAPLIKELRQYIRQKLPEYMVPSAIVVLDEMPLTANGKVDRRALPAPAQVTREETFVAPRDAIEEQLAKLWIEMLGLKQVSINDNFFDLGGHSLLASRLVSRTRETFHVELPLRSLFETATIAEMARAMIAHEAKPGQTEKIARFLKRLEAMSAEEVKLALQKTAGGD